MYSSGNEILFLGEKENILRKKTICSHKIIAICTHMAGATGGVLGVQTPTALDVTTLYLVGG